MKKAILGGFGILGMILFIPLFVFTFVTPQLVENSGKKFIEWKLKSEVNNKINSIQLPAPTNLEKLLGNKVKELRSETEERLENLKQQLKIDAPNLIAEQIVKLRYLDCECRKKWVSFMKNSMHIEEASLEAAKEKLINFSQMKYMEIVKKLTLDIRIFLGANSIIFSLLFLISFLKPLAINHLFLPCGLMLASTSVCSYFYLFEQNWFYTIIYNDYTGYSFIAYLVVVFAILCDIVFNRARVTTEVINSFLQAIGQVGNLVPC